MNVDGEALRQRWLVSNLENCNFVPAEFVNVNMKMN